ncbi:DMT family transporter [Mannheimia massilioguelmaensis]|uniref:DMT family transporter n=1 Tax=Mannheimia massilioguelmaensis TaxID=1604354 RepID=UPI0005C8C966|nr:EamA family transporter [Mannheimia massilioguelmaensis]
MIYQIIAMLIWASAFIAAKYTYEIMDPVLMVQCRFFIASLVLLPTFFKAYNTIPKTYIKTMWILAFVNFPVVFLLQFIGLYYTSAASAVTMLGMIPLLSVLIGYFFFNQYIRPIDLLLSIIAFIGILLTVIGGQGDSHINVWGCLLVLASAVAFCFCLYLSKDVMKTMKSKDYTNVIIVLGTVLCIPFSILLVKDWTIIPTFKGIASLFYLGLMCTCFAVVLWFKGVQTSSVYISSLLSTLEPVFGVLLAILILGDRFSFISALGVLLTLGAMLISVFAPLIKRKI